MIYTISADRFARSPGALDYWAITPDMFWVDRGVDTESRFGDLPHWIEALEWAAPRLPIVAHHIGLSIGSSCPLDQGYVSQLLSWQGRWNYPWISDHLSFAQIEHGAHKGSAGIALPLPYDRSVLDMICARVSNLLELSGGPLLLENPARYIAYPDEELTETEFINALCARTGCGLLLDLHNLHCNSVNHMFDALQWLEAIDLDHVVEVHVAGGAMIGDIYADSHSGGCPNEVWDLLEHVVPRAPHIRGITFEFHDSYFDRMGGDACLEREITRARKVWQRCN